MNDYGEPRLSKIGKKAIQIDLLHNILEVNHKNAYQFSISCYGFGFIMEMDNFYKMKDLMDVVRGYFKALETEAGIGLKKESFS